ncbi:hypothetical protein ES288_D11G246700v1 [Gossypium darwinii]|uniref:ABC transporter domain-containing protein n=1 Tax=Gossypium darwinii TaxID=34276 RepID=A0A5D2APE9_GOSDA|nr:hypothetical protein ES288_D11G246700v1 [Gossypium darwinii]
MDSLIIVPRWTPRPRPSISSQVHQPQLANDDLKIQSIVSQQDDSYKLSNSREMNFPFSIGVTRSNDPPPYSGIHELTSFRIEMETTAASDCRPDPTPKVDGIFLTWTNLWVIVDGGKKGTKTILQGLNGYAEPGKVLAIMGPSGCGKLRLRFRTAICSNLTLYHPQNGLVGNTHLGCSNCTSPNQYYLELIYTKTQYYINILFKTKDNSTRRVLSSRTQQTGEILVNSRKETLAFGTFLQLSDSMSVFEKKERAEMTIREMGLQDSIDTRIGGWSTKGLSDGQKRRLSICIEIITWPKLLFLDEPTSGLDSAAFYHARGSRLMFVAAFLTFMAIGGFPSFVEDMKVFGRERLNGHYGVGAFVVGNTISSIPYLFMISLIPRAIAYYLVGLQKSLGHFAYFVILLFTTMILVESLMMTVASIVPDFLMGIITGADIQGVIMLNGGFFRLPNDLPKPFWRYVMYYIAFHKYANKGFYKNEFEGLSFPNNQAGGSPTSTGDEVLRSFWHLAWWIYAVFCFGELLIPLIRLNLLSNLIWRSLLSIQVRY